MYVAFFFLFDRQAPAQRSARRCTSVASHAACRGGLTVDVGIWTKFGINITVTITFRKANFGLNLD